MSTAAQIRQIKTLQRQAGLDDADYRALLIHHGGAASSVLLTEAQAGRVIAALRRLPGADRSPQALQSLGRAAGPYAKKLQSLWISGHNLGVQHDRTDRALHAWMRKRFGVAHTRFLVEPYAANLVIEGLKAWIAREGGVHWPASAAPRDQARAVVEAIAMRILREGDGGEAGRNPAGFGHRAARLPVRLDAYSVRELHDLATLMGTALRAMRPTAAKPPRQRSVA